MQHSPQEIKSRLDKAVDSEGNVLDMVAVLELVTTLERLPLTREALETTRIGKTINLLRKKTDNEDLAKRAKKLVKKWQKLVINQLEASRSVDSPLNGSRISSPQINGAIRDGKPTTVEKLLKGKVSDGSKKGLKRKRSTSSLSNSPLTLSQDTSPCTPSDQSSNPASPFITITTTELLSKETLHSSENKRQKVTVDTKEANGGIQKLQGNEIDGKSTSDITKPNDQDVNININTTQDINNSNSHDSNLDQSLDSFHNDSGIDSLGSHVNTSLYSQQQLTPSQEIDCNTTDNSLLDSNVQKEIKNEIKSNNTERNLENSITKNGTSLQDSVDTEERKEGTVSGTEISNSLTPTLESVKDLSEEVTSSTNLTDLENLHETSEAKGIISQTSEAKEIINDNKSNEKELVEVEEMETEKLEEPTEPKELVLDLDQEANGINGRFNDQGTWYSWTDVMPSNDGSLNILPYVILD